MDVKNTHSVTKTEISVFGRQALDAERRRSPSLADKVLSTISKLSAKYQLCAIHTADNTDGKLTSVRRLSAVSEKVHRLDPPPSGLGGGVLAEWVRPFERSHRTGDR